MNKYTYKFISQQSADKYEEEKIQNKTSYN